MATYKISISAIDSPPIIVLISAASTNLALIESIKSIVQPVEFVELLEVL